MAIIREFETMLNDIKTKSAYNGVEYNNPGPAHLSIGQEASAVGEAYCLDIDDLTFGSHRSHGEILAKGLSSIQKLNDEELYAVMKEFLDGSVLNVVEKHMTSQNIKDLAINFLLYGALAEVFARTTGFNRGLGGSMHAFFIPFGIMPNNAIVGSAAPVALGAALYKRSNHKKGIVVANFGDGACGRGPALESFNFASMDQIKKLWNDGSGEGTTIKVHALKSTSRAIGADDLGALAEKLEFAGKAGDEGTLDAELAGLLERYRALGAALSPLYAPAKETQGELPLISENELSEAYQSIREFAENMDADSAEYALSYLDGFRIPEGEQERVEQLRNAVRGFDWGRVNKLLS